ncbi:MAG: acetoacetate--CoA ligase [Gulosibacter sp.]|uniref:acetoacetate--CoA ligase n=1 Tax=Gulosibacter sp. TaxID=2817531 RepID=UPI003F8E4EFC
MIINPKAAEGEVIWRPADSVVSGAQITRFGEYLHEQGIHVDESYESIWNWSTNEPKEFWSHFADFAGIQFGGSPGPAHNDVPMPETTWFPGRTVNFAQHLLVERDGTALEFVAEDNTVTPWSWKRLRGEVASLASHLRALGVGKGDCVVAVLPNVPEAAVGLLAAASIGAIWSVCAPEFGPGAIISRFAQMTPKVLLATPGYLLGGKDRNRTNELAEVIQSLPSVEQIVWVTNHTTVAEPSTERASIRWDEVVAEEGELEFAETGFSEPLWVLFSSGTTGTPKGIVHSHGGALLETQKMLLIHSDLRPGDRYFNVASTSWVLWNSLIAALGLGAVPVIVDGNPTYPTVDRVWEVAALTGAAAVGVSAGFVHACAKTDLVPKRDHDLSSLRCVQVTGSPLSTDGFRWVYEHVGDVWLTSMSGGTDIASVFVGGSPTLPVRVGYIQAPALGVSVEAWSDDGQPTGGRGELVVTEPMPSMPLYFWGDEDRSRYRSSYFEHFPGVWRHGDFIEFNEAGILIHGRSDSTLNRNGLRLGSADIYAVVEAIPSVAEALVVGAEIGTEGYFMPLFVKLSRGAEPEATAAEVRAQIRAHLSPRYLPDAIVAMRGIPHTRTGKKLEVPIKRLLQGAALEEVADLDAVDDASLLAEYAEYAAGAVAV